MIAFDGNMQHVPALLSRVHNISQLAVQHKPTGMDHPAELPHSGHMVHIPCQAMGDLPSPLVPATPVPARVEMMLLPTSTFLILWTLDSVHRVQQTPMQRVM